MGDGEAFAADTGLLTTLEGGVKSVGSDCCGLGVI